MKMHATILLAGKTATGFEVPPEVLEGLGSSRRPAVRVTINGYTYPSTVATMDGKFMIPVSAEVRERAGVAAGDDVDVDLVLDTEPREVTVPPDFAEALAKDPEAQQRFAGLTYSHKRQHVLAIESAKTPETRQRRIVSAINKLHES